MTQSALQFKGAQLLCVVVSLVLAGVIWHKQIRYRIWPKNFGVVQDGAVYRGANQRLNVLQEICRQYEIRTVVDLAGPDRGEDQLCEELGVTRFTFELPGDGRGDPVEWAAVLKILSDPERQPVFVQCAAGAQRTSTAVMLYQKFVQGASFQECYSDSFQYRHEPDEWELLSFLADNGEHIGLVWRSGTYVRNGTESSLGQLVDVRRTTIAHHTSHER